MQIKNRFRRGVWPEQLSLSVLYKMSDDTKIHCIGKNNTPYSHF